jgi:hypothetical protein
LVNGRRGNGDPRGKKKEEPKDQGGQEGKGFGEEKARGAKGEVFQDAGDEGRVPLAQGGGQARQSPAHPKAPSAPKEAPFQAKGGKGEAEGREEEKGEDRIREGEAKATKHVQDREGQESGEAQSQEAAPQTKGARKPFQDRLGFLHDHSALIPPRPR